MFKPSNLNDCDLKIVEKRKTWFFMPVAVIVLAIIMLVIFSLTANSPINMGVDFSGGYSITVSSTAITTENYDEYIRKIDVIASELSNDKDENFGLKIADYRRTGTDSTKSSIHITYKRIKGLSDAEMIEVGERFEETLINKMVRVVPVIEITGGQAIIIYDRVITAFKSNIETQIIAVYPNASLEWASATELKFANAGTLSATVSELEDAASILDEYAVSVSEAGTIGRTVARDIVLYSMTAALIAYVIVFIYYAMRFRSITSAFTLSLALLLDIIMLFSFMIITHIEITAVFMTALLVMFAYSIYSKVIVFGKIRENIKTGSQGESTVAIANKAVSSIFKHSLYMFLISFVFIALLGIVSGIAGLFAVMIFSLIALFGFVAAFFSSIFIVPSIWYMMNKTLRRTSEKNKTKKKEKKLETI